MARVTGPSRTELDARGDEFAARVTRAIRTTLRNVAPTTRVVDDLGRIQTIWRSVVKNSLAPHLRTAWNTAVLGVRVQLEEINERERQTLLAAVFEIPKVSNPLAESFLADATNRLVAIGDVVWYTARGEMLTGMELGEGVAELRERVVASASVSQKRAEVIARTEVNSAMNNGAYQQMKALDVATIKEWIATNDSRTRESHEEVDGEEIDGDAKFMVGGYAMDHPHDLNAPPGETINCVIGSTQVDTPLIKMAMRSWFEGNLIEIRTAAGKTLTVTPNHPVLTSRGLTPANELQVGDHVVCGDVTRQFPWSEYDEKRAPTLISEIFDSATDFRVPRDRERMANFHGERRQAEVRVVREDRQLGFEAVTFPPKNVEELRLAATYGTTASDGSRTSCSIPLGVAGGVTNFSGEPPSGGICVECQPPARARIYAHVAHSIGNCDRSEFDSVLNQHSADCTARDPKFLTYGDHRFAVEVSLDDVVSLTLIPFEGHVYNLDTTAGWYTGNSIITGNCRCTLAWEIVDDEDDYEDDLVAGAFHLPGRHEQKNHGRRGGKSSAASKSKSKSLADIVDSDAITKLLDDPESFDYSSKKSDDRILAEIVKQRGFDAKPTLIDSLPAGSVPMGRAVTDRKFAEQFLTGDYFAGKGQFGNGTYFLQSSDASNLNTTLSLYGDHQIRAALKPDARTVTRTDLEVEMKALIDEAEQNEKDVYGKAIDYIQRGDMDGFQRDYGRAQRRTQLLRDPGRVAALLGYDAIFVTPGQGDTEVVVLNRGAVQAERSIR